MADRVPGMLPRETVEPMLERSILDQLGLDALARHYNAKALEREAFRMGVAEAVHCDTCHQLRDAHHVIEIRVRLVSTFLCGYCLDALAETIYTHCSKANVPHWRRNREG